MIGTKNNINNVIVNKREINKSPIFFVYILYIKTVIKLIFKKINEIISIRIDPYILIKTKEYKMQTNEKINKFLE
ncbi:hypothetical protein AD951_01210 [Acetobacter malorum]|uniref:Uncharacterized protein n=1 Tax=Acetobacter malorum TaxID=178901 RepID=A0A149UXD4_9PROT|nr:hypothetical protein AD951_01210 [Acetobacter malorum]